jgi:hypothetical protein
MAFASYVIENQILMGYKRLSAAVTLQQGVFFYGSLL